MLAAIVKAMIAFTTIIRVGVNYLDCHCIITKQLQTGVCFAGDHTSGEVEMGEGKTVLGAQRIFSTVWGYFAVADTCFEFLLGQQLPYPPHLPASSTVPQRRATPNSKPEASHRSLICRMPERTLAGTDPCPNYQSPAAADWRQCRRRLALCCRSLSSWHSGPGLLPHSVL